MNIRISFNRIIGDDYPTFFICDVAANHNGSLDHAKELIRLAADAGADAVKFQHFQAPKIVSEQGFAGVQIAHQAGWRKSVYETYKDASIPYEWTRELWLECKEAGVVFCSTPYDEDAVTALEPYVPFWKIGSGDITFLPFLRYIASKKKPVILSTGASDIGEVAAAMRALEGVPVVLCQCNTAYDADDDKNIKHMNLRVLDAYRAMWPDAVLGLSDHTRRAVPVIGAVTLGARVIERHFTSNRFQAGPDHRFSLEPHEWRGMVASIRDLEAALGSPLKQVEANERETVVVQRRALRLIRELHCSEPLLDEHIKALRPCPADAIPASEIDQVLGLKLNRRIEKGDYLRWRDVR